jgi:hypothetical protein
MVPNRKLVNAAKDAPTEVPDDELETDDYA